MAAASPCSNYNFWVRHFGSSPAVLGRGFGFQGKQFQIVGVIQKGFDGLMPGYRTDVWFPSMHPTAAQDPDSGWDSVWGRLEPGVRPSRPGKCLQAAFTNYRRDHSDEFIRSGGASRSIGEL